MYRTLAKINPEAFLPDVAMTLNNLAILHRDKNELEQAQREYKETLRIYQAQAERNRKGFLPYVAMTALNMSIFYQSSIPDQERSLKLVKECIEAGLPFLEVLPSAQNYMRAAINVVQNWGLDVELFLKEMGLE